MPEREPQFVRPETEEEKKPEYQEIKDIIFEEVEGGDPDFDKARRLAVFPDESREKAGERLKEELIRENWWLQEEWQEKGPPGEQVEVTIGDKKLNIYNFGEESLTDRHLEELERVVKEFAQIRNGEIFNEVQYVLIGNVQKRDQETDREWNGYGAVYDKAIAIYPRGTKFIPHRIEGVSNFEGTLIHELSHSIQDVDLDFANDWANEFGWEIVETKKGHGWRNKHPEKCVNDYARQSHDEDIPESMVAALRSPEVLDSERLRFLRESLLAGISAENAPEVAMSRNTGEDIKLPKIEAPVKFKRVESRIKVL